MTKQEKAERYKAKQRAAEAARRAALGLPPYNPAPPQSKRRQKRDRFNQPRHMESYEDRLDDLGESPDF